MRILRPTLQTPLLSADVFEELFDRHLADLLDVHQVDTVTWLSSILEQSEDPLSPVCVAKFASLVKHTDFLCPSHTLIPVTPYLLLLRALAGSPARLLFIAHAPGAYLMELAWMSEMLSEGDIIAAPSACAADTMIWLYPELEPYIHVMTHPVHALPFSDAPPTRRFVSMCRLGPDKLIHRQIEALHLLRKRGIRNVTMEIAGELTTPDAVDTQYARLLRTMIDRLDLQKSVRLVGPVRGDEARGEFLAGATAALALSVSTEEALPKASIEPLAMGIPVIACAWNGYNDTVVAGIRIPVTQGVYDMPDVSPAAIADAMQKMLETPPDAESCLKNAQMFSPANSRSVYEKVLKQAMKKQPECNMPKGSHMKLQGYAGHAAVLQALSWKELAGCAGAFARIHLSRLQGEEVSELCRDDTLRELLRLSLTPSIAYRYSGWEPDTLLDPHPYDPPSCDHVSIEKRLVNSMLSTRLQPARASAVEYACSHEDPETGRIALQAEQTLSCQRRRDIQQVKHHLRMGRYRQAREVFQSSPPLSSTPPSAPEHARLWARVCRACQTPADALPLLRSALERFQNTEHEGSLWVDVAAALSQTDELHDAWEALDQASALLGPVPAVQSVRKQIAGLAITRELMS